MHATIVLGVTIIWQIVYVILTIILHHTYLK